MRVLIIHGSKLGGTAGIANTIANRLQVHGVETVVAAAAEKTSPDGFDAVLVGGALYANRWHKSARQYVKRHQSQLQTMPVWMFSSGPLDDSALAENIPPTPHAVAMMELVGARGHITFGGRLEEDAEGMLAGAMAKKMAGDWRDMTQIMEWTDQVSQELTKTHAA